MAAKDLLVHIDGSRSGLARLDTAIALAAAHDAHLIGLHVIAAPRIPAYVMLEIPEDVLEAQVKRTQQATDSLRADFDDRVRRAGVRGEWRAVEGVPENALSLHARYADFTIIGQGGAPADDGPDNAGSPEQIVLGCGRPVLVVPFTGVFPVIGEHVMVAWDASRLSARAVNDALPLMQDAKKVLVVAVNPKPGEAEGHGEIPSADICLHLARHGIDAVARALYADDVGIGDALLAQAADEAIDLLVCGAYGHARWREVVLGGVTRHLFRHMTIPVLMSH